MKRVFLILAVLGQHAMAFGQWSLVISSKAEKDGKGLGGAKIELLQGTKVVSQMLTASNGDFKIEVPPNGEYIIQVSYPGCNTKIFQVFTRGVPPEVALDDFSPKYKIGGFTMKEPLYSIDYSALKNPLVKIVYFSEYGKFDHVEAHTENVLNALGKIKAAEDDLLARQAQAVKDGDAALKKKDCELAKTNYQKAISLIPQPPYEEYPKTQLLKCDKCIADKDVDGKKAAEEAEAKAAAEKAAAEKLAKEKADADKKAAEELARQQAEKAKKEKELADKLAKEQAAADLAKAQQELKTKEALEKNNKEAAEKQAAADLQKAEKDKQEREKTDKAAAEKLAKEKEEAEKKELANRKKAEQEKLALEKENQKAQEAAKLATEKEAADRKKKEEQKKAEPVTQIKTEPKNEKIAVEAKKPKKKEVPEKPIAITEEKETKEPEKVFVNNKKEIVLSDKPVIIPVDQSPKEGKNKEIGSGKAKRATPMVLGADPYKLAIERADDYYKMKRYAEAKEAYEEALKYRDKDIYATSRLELISVLTQTK